MSAPFSVGPWQIHPAAYRILRDGHPYPVDPKPMAVLCLLAQHPGEVVPRATIMAALWPDTYVVDEALTRCISELRKVFKDTPHTPQVIETVRGVGYRLVPPVAPVPPVSPVPPIDAVPAAPTARSWPAWAGMGLLGVLLVGAGVFLLRDKDAASATPLQVLPVTAYDGVEQEPELSPNGRYVAFSWAGTTQNEDIYLKAVDGGVAQRLTTDPATDRSPTWSPDGARIAFIRRSTSGDCHIYSINTLGADLRLLGPCGANYYNDLTWAPDGQWLAYSDAPQPGQPSAIVLFSPDTGTRRVLGAPTQAHSDHEPAFSPDGRRLAFMRVYPGERQALMVRTLATDALQQVTAAHHGVAGLTWSGNGQRLVYGASQNGTFGLWHVPVPAQQGTPATPSWIPTGRAQVQYPHIAGGQTRLVFEQRILEINLWRYPLDSLAQAPRRVVHSTQKDLMPHLSPDGTRLAFVSDRSGYGELWGANPDGTDLVQYTALHASFMGPPRWAPDGKRLVFDVKQQAGHDLYLLDVSTRALRQLTTHPADDILPSWAQDGRRIYFNSARSGTPQIWMLPLDGTPPVMLTRQGGFLAYEAPDAERLYYTRKDTAGLWTWTPADRTETLVMPALKAWANWGIGRNGIYYLDRRQDQTEVVWLAPETARETARVVLPQVAPWSIPWQYPSLTVSADGSAVYFAQRDRQGADLFFIDAFQ